MNEETTLEEYTAFEQSVDNSLSTIIAQNDNIIEQNNNIIEGLSLGYKLLFIIFVLLIITWLLKFFINMFK